MTTAANPWPPRSHNLSLGDQNRGWDFAGSSSRINTPTGGGRSLQHLGARRMQAAAQQPGLPWGNAHHGGSSGSRGVPQLESAPPSRQRPASILAQTHAGGGGFGARLATPGSVSGEKQWAGQQPGKGAARFYATAPAPRISSSTVEEATGVRLNDDQLEALKNRYQGRASGWLGGNGNPGEVNTDLLRQEVFSSIVLKPGQWPRFSCPPISEVSTPRSQSNTSRAHGRARGS